MKSYLDEQIIAFANANEFPVYVVGGAVRNFLLGEKKFNDIDIASPVSAEVFCERAKEFGFEITAEYKRTHTVKLKGKYASYEFSSFRTECYSSGGEHTPTEANLTTDITEDAKRRDFKCNAVYYDITLGVFVDPLGGIKDIERRMIDTVVDAREVFSHDGLRIMRLARFCGSLGFTPSKRAYEACTEYANNLKDISAERIYDELKKILVADTAYPFSPRDGHYKALRLLSDTYALDVILPELTAGRNMAQRSDFHKYDVLEHSLRTVLYGDKEVRLACLLHDVAKPYCKINFDMYAMHEKYGEDMSRDILTRLKADNKTIEEVVYLVGQHMVDLKSDMRENKVRVFIVKNQHMLDKLFLVKQADYRACYDYEDDAPTVVKWKKILEDMKAEGVPFSLKGLKISAEELIEIGFRKEAIGEQLDELLEMAVMTPSINENSTLKSISQRKFERMGQWQE